MEINLGHALKRRTPELLASAAFFGAAFVHDGVPFVTIVKALVETSLAAGWCGIVLGIAGYALYSADRELIHNKATNPISGFKAFEAGSVVGTLFPALLTGIMLLKNAV